MTKFVALIFILQMIEILFYCHFYWLFELLRSDNAQFPIHSNTIFLWLSVHLFSCILLYFFFAWNSDESTIRALTKSVHILFIPCTSALNTIGNYVKIVCYTRSLRLFVFTVTVRCFHIISSFFRLVFIGAFNS